MERKHLSSPFLDGHVPFSPTFLFMDKNERGREEQKLELGRDNLTRIIIVGDDEG